MSQLAPPVVKTPVLEKDGTFLDYWQRWLGNIPKVLANLANGGTAETRNGLIQFRRGTAAEWTAENPILADGEPGFERDTGQLKIGNGTDDWTTLTYV